MHEDAEREERERPDPESLETVIAIYLIFALLWGVILGLGILVVLG
jgi:hypothetical protein